MANSSSFYQLTNMVPAAAASLQSQIDQATAAAAAATAAAATATSPTLFSSNMLTYVATLPTSNPHVNGQPWWNGESVSISTG